MVTDYTARRRRRDSSRVPLFRETTALRGPKPSPARAHDGSRIPPRPRGPPCRRGRPRAASTTRRVPGLSGGYVGVDVFFVFSGLPHHRAPPARSPSDRDDLAPELLRPARPAAPAGFRARPGRHASSCRRWSCRRCACRTSPAIAASARSTSRTSTSRCRPPTTCRPSWRRRRSSISGRSASRSSSTCSGRRSCCWSSASARVGRRSGAGWAVVAGLIVAGLVRYQPVADPGQRAVGVLLAARPGRGSSASGRCSAIGATRLARIPGSHGCRAGLGRAGDHLLSAVVLTTATPYPGTAALLPTVGGALVIAGGLRQTLAGPGPLAVDARSRDSSVGSPTRSTSGTGRSSSSRRP